jgi:DNA primase
MKDPADVLQKFGAETLKMSVKSVILDFEYLITRGKILYDISIPQGKSRAFAILFPYLNVLESRIERDACIAYAADELRADKTSLQKDFERWLISGRINAEKPKSEEAGTAESIRMTDELFLMTLIAVNTELYSEFRRAVSMREIEDPAAKELFIALEECFAAGEAGLDIFLSHISTEKLRNYIIERSMSAEFTGDVSRNSRKIMEDGLKRLKSKKMRRRLSEIGAELRMMERNSGMASEADLRLDSHSELINEKMQIDAELRLLEGN